MKTLELTTVKKQIVEKIQKQYGSVDKFLETDFGKSLGKNVKTYLYPSGAVSFPVLKILSEHLGLGTLDKKLVVTRTITYTLSRNRGKTKYENNEKGKDH